MTGWCRSTDCDFLARALEGNRQVEHERMPGKVVEDDAGHQPRRFDEASGSGQGRLIEVGSSTAGFKVKAVAPQRTSTWPEALRDLIARTEFLGTRPQREGFEASSRTRT